MSEESTTLYILSAVCVVAVVGLGLSLASLVTNESVAGMMGGSYGGGGMMGGGGGTTAASHPGLLEWTLLTLSIVLIGVVMVLVVRGRASQPSAAPPAPMSVGLAPVAPPGPVAAAVTASAATPAMVPSTPAAPAPVPEPTLVKLLDEDERRMYLEIRDHGGAMLQRDLVALGIFSKAKVTRVLDKLEAKGIVVREAHGMTNRVRLTAAAAR